MRARTRAPHCMLRQLRESRGSAPVEFVLTGTLLTLLVLSVLQLALSLHVRNTVIDAASEGARHAALADRSLADGVARTRELITTALGPAYATDVSATTDSRLGRATAIVTVRAPLPLLGLAGPDHALEVHGHAPIETFE